MMGPDAASEWTARAQSIERDRQSRTDEELQALVEELTREADAYMRQYDLMSSNEYRNFHPDREQLPGRAHDVEREQRQVTSRRRIGLFKMLHGALAPAIASLDELIELVFDEMVSSPRVPRASGRRASAQLHMRPTPVTEESSSEEHDAHEPARVRTLRRFERLRRLRPARSGRGVSS